MRYFSLQIGIIFLVTPLVNGGIDSLLGLATVLVGLATARWIIPAVREAGQADGESWIRPQAIIRRNDCGCDCHVTYHDFRRGPRCRVLK